MVSFFANHHQEILCHSPCKKNSRSITLYYNNNFLFCYQEQAKVIKYWKYAWLALFLSLFAVFLFQLSISMFIRKEKLFNMKWLSFYYLFNCVWFMTLDQLIRLEAHEKYITTCMSLLHYCRISLCHHGPFLYLFARSSNALVQVMSLSCACKAIFLRVHINFMCVGS